LKLLEHYEVIIRTLKQTNIDIPLTTTEIATMLSCSYRNAKIIIRKLQEAGWIDWIPGRGRGNYSSIKLLRDLNLLVIEKAKKMATSSSIDESLNFLGRYRVSDNEQRDFLEWLFYSLMNEKNNLPVDDQMDRLQFPSYRPLPILEPALVNRRSENHVMRHIFNQLVTYNETTSTHLPQLAHHWRHNDNYTEWVFYLRKGVSFHNGVEMDAEAVYYSFQRHRLTSSAYQWIVSNMEQVVPLNKYIVQFTFTAPAPYFLHLASSLGGSIVPKEIGEQFKTAPIGTGPFQVKENNDHKLVLETFKNYFSTRPFLDEVSMYFYPQLYDNQKTNDFTDDDHINFYHYPYKHKVSEQFEQFTSIDRGSKLLTLNMNQGVLANDPLLRKAIHHCLIPEKLISELRGNRFIPATRMLSGLEDKDSLVRNVSVARDCLKRSTYKGEELKLFTYTGAGNELDAKWIKDQLYKLGIPVSLYVYSYEDLHKLPLGEEADMLLGEQLPDESKLYTYLSSFKGNHSLLKHHLPNSVSEKILSLTTLGNKELDLLTFLQKIEGDIVNQHGQIHLYRLQQFAVYPEHLKDIHINALGWVDYTRLWYN
jgi:SgrR family transcriptional regulator